MSAKELAPRPTEKRRTESIEALQGRRSAHDLARSVTGLVDTPAHHGNSHHRESHRLDEEERAETTRMNEDHRELEEPLQRRLTQSLPNRSRINVELTNRKKHSISEDVTPPDSGSLFLK